MPRMAFFWYRLIDRWVRWWKYKKRKLEKSWCPSVWESYSRPILLKNLLADLNSLVTILYPLSLLIFILLQGSFYWAILIRRLSNPQFGSGSVPKLYGGFRILDLVLLISVFPFIVWNTQSFQVAILATLIRFVIWYN